MRQIDYIILHHSKSPLTTTRDDIKKWHVNDNKWSDIGYHFVIEGDGKLRLGRSTSRSGAHTKGFNENSIGICIVGDNTRPEHSWNIKQIEVLKSFLVFLKTQYPGCKIKGHRDFTKTTCPGLPIEWLCEE